MALSFPEKKKPASQQSPNDWFEFLLRTLIPFLGVIAALLISAVILLFLKTNPIVAYGSMFKGAFGSINGWSQSLVKATPLLLVGLGICIAFRAPGLPCLSRSFRVLPAPRLYDDGVSCRCLLGTYTRFSQGKV